MYLRAPNRGKFFEALMTVPSQVRLDAVWQNAGEKAQRKYLGGDWTKY
jgi:hypothetical protein